MSRPRKCRKVCCMPGCNKFGPLDQMREPDNYIVMSVDEYETVRLIDLEGLTQEECAGQMNVARTTVQSIYNNARRKLSDSLVNGKVLQIEGGDYKLCDSPGDRCGKDSCRRRKASRDEAGE